MEALRENEAEEKEEEKKAFKISDELQDLEEKLSKIQVHIPNIHEFDWSSMDTSHLPASYKINSAKEKMMLHIAANFRRQYTHLCPDRKELFLHPLNECGVEKFVSTTVRPTLLPYPELYNWDGCARFVSDYLTMEPLPNPIEPPSSLVSPTTILKYQRGNCFDFSMLLCSLLIGVGYDAYCVYGYATRETCMMDETREVCPLLKKSKEAQKETVKEKTEKYAVKPPRDLRSKFELQQAAKKEAEIQVAKQKKQEEEEERIMEAEKPKPDSLYGLRVHAWVLILSGKREVPESFFIDPFTAKSYSTTDGHFLGIEALWNHVNYWVNMQSCLNGCKDLIFDLGNPLRWEFMLLGADKPLLLLPNEEEEEELADEDLDNLVKEEEEKGSDMPPSWVDPIQISLKEFETRCPQGKKVIHYKKAKLEKWAPYLNSNGLVERLTVFEDQDCTKVLEVRQWFKNREDLLEMRQVNKITEVTTEYFGPGHVLGLKAHVYKSMNPETERTMEFYNKTRVDGLQKRVENACEMMEYFVGRSDFLYYRHTNFGKRTKRAQILVANPDANARPIMQIKECFHRNLEKPANEDVAERIFMISEERILLTYHLQENYITASKREFTKRADVDNKGNKIIMTPDMCLSYQVGSSQEDKKLIHLYKMMLKLMEEEKHLKHQVWESGTEVLEILKIREEEEGASKLTVSIYDTERNEKGKKQREAMEHQMQEERQRQDEQDLDYLAPFIIQMGNIEKMTKWQALRLKEDCLTDFKYHLIDKANIIQVRFEKETQELQKKQQWYQQNQLSMTVEDEEAYIAYCSDAMFRIRILEMRLNRHKETAPQKYIALEEKLCKDPRLSEYLKLYA
ncbi:PREDICTED: dynein regulatory complex subunit 7 isoform X1 [Gavialis gangeticus]|uniref:dynein regulatory complex subunit 7 isoform X1 n=1 Tax=Gavialis gangeticus TaxID=94835 RepID=UPI00092E5292|nr:PREDICTED: dynein regulatory complex subunit 7 isoform X1 [Gavialis gangeticus]